MSPETAANRWHAQATVTVLGAGAALMGVLMCAGGTERFASPALATARMVPGSPYSWGIAISLAGFAALLGAATDRRGIVRAGLFTMIVWYGFFDISLIVAAFAGPVSLTGIAVYTMAALLCAITWGSAKTLPLGRTRPARSAAGPSVRPGDRPRSLTGG